jgi:hypothetical protein
MEKLEREKAVVELAELGGVAREAVAAMRSETTGLNSSFSKADVRVPEIEENEVVSSMYITHGRKSSSRAGT